MHFFAESEILRNRHSLKFSVRERLHGWWRQCWLHPPRQTSNFDSTVDRTGWRLIVSRTCRSCSLPFVRCSAPLDQLDPVSRASPRPFDRPGTRPPLCHLISAVEIHGISGWRWVASLLYADTCALNLETEPPTCFRPPHQTRSNCLLNSRAFLLTTKGYICNLENIKKQINYFL